MSENLKKAHAKKQRVKDGAAPDANSTREASTVAPGNGSGGTMVGFDRNEELKLFADQFKGAVLSGSGYLVPCPAHGGDTPSLSIKLRRDGQGVVLKCQAGCKPTEVLRALGFEWQDLYFRASSALGGGVYRRAPKRLIVTEKDRDFYHEVYQELLSGLKLYSRDRNYLKNRGLSDEAIDRNQYRALLAPDDTARRLFDKYGPDLYRVLGFWESNRRPLMENAIGLLIPCRDPQGRINALQIRLDAEPFGCYWVSRETWGVGAVHVPLGTAAPSPLVRVTDCGLNADVIAALDPEKVPTVAVTTHGPPHWVLPTLQSLGTQTVRLAFDADWRTSRWEAALLLGLGDYLAGEGYQVAAEVWDRAAGKSLDKVLLTKGRREVVPFQEIRPQIEAAAA
jgi:hypothetical protein